MSTLDESLDLSDSGPTPLYPDPTQQGLARLEKKVDKIAAVLNKFILVEERQSIQREEIDELAKDIKTLVARVDATERKMDKWINLGVGGWTVIIVLWAVYTNVFKP